MENVVKNFNLIKQEIIDKKKVRLVAVTKTFPISHILPVINEGHTDFGENKVQEAKLKFENIQNPAIKWCITGHLQTNKVKQVVDFASEVHSLDRLNLAEQLDRQLQKKGRELKVLVQVNSSNEPQKYGLAQEEIAILLEDPQYLDKIDFNGLMCIPPYNEEPSPYFALLSKIANKFDIKYLSMGMSSDFEKAIQFGATHVRVGSEIFGSRS